MTIKRTPFLDGILDDLVWGIHAEAAAQAVYLNRLTDPIHHQRHLRPHLRYLYMFLRDYAYAYGGEDFPSLSQLAYALHASQRSICDWLDDLEDAGLIHKTHRSGQGFFRNHYEVIELPEA